MKARVVKHIKANSTFCLFLAVILSFLLNHVRVILWLVSAADSTHYICMVTSYMQNKTRFVKQEIFDQVDKVH